MSTREIRPPKLPRLIPIATVMETLGLSERTVRALVAQGVLPGYQYPSGTIRVDLAAVEAYLEAARITPDSPTGAAPPTATRAPRHPIQRAAVGIDELEATA